MLMMSVRLPKNGYAKMQKPSKMPSNISTALVVPEILEPGNLVIQCIYYKPDCHIQ